METGDNSEHETKRNGRCEDFDGNHKAKSLYEVLHVPTFRKNLISVGQMVEMGYQVKFNHKECFVEDPNQRKEGRMFNLDIDKGQSKKAMFITYGGTRGLETLDLWPKRCGHINIQRLKDMESC